MLLDVLCRGVGTRTLHSFICTTRKAGTLVLAEHVNNGLSASTRSDVVAGVRANMKVTVIPLRDLGGLYNVRAFIASLDGAAVFNCQPCDVLILGHNSTSAAELVAKVPGVRTVLHGDDPAYEHQIAENVSVATALTAKRGKYSHIVLQSSMAGQNLVGRLAVEMDVAPIVDIIEILSEDTFKRPVYAGNAIATLKATDPVKLLSIRPTAFDKAPEMGGEADIANAELPETTDLGLVQFKGEKLGGGDRPDLTTAPVVISGGRGLKSREGFKMLEELADLMGGAVGASRAAVDAGFVPNELQIGQTGKVVAPDLYVAVGISGAIQHLSGMKDSKCIVAVDKDSEAPIFSIADYGLVGDLFDIVPELVKKIRGS